jgi:hypothetical protein
MTFVTPKTYLWRLPSAASARYTCCMEVEFKPNMINVTVEEVIICVDMHLFLS